MFRRLFLIALSLFMAMGLGISAWSWAGGPEGGQIVFVERGGQLVVSPTRTTFAGLSLRGGDTLVMLNQVEVETPSKLVRAVGEAPTFGTLTMVVRRAGEEVVLYRDRGFRFEVDAPGDGTVHLDLFPVNGQDSGRAPRAPDVAPERPFSADVVAPKSTPSSTDPGEVVIEPTSISTLVAALQPPQLESTVPPAPPESASRRSDEADQLPLVAPLPPLHVAPKEPSLPREPVQHAPNIAGSDASPVESNSGRTERLPTMEPTLDDLTLPVATSEELLPLVEAEEASEETIEEVPPPLPLHPSPAPATLGVTHFPLPEVVAKSAPWSQRGGQCAQSRDWHPLGAMLWHIPNRLVPGAFPCPEPVERHSNIWTNVR